MEPNFLDAKIRIGVNIIIPLIQEYSIVTVLIDSSDHLSMDIKEYLDLRLACIVYTVRLFNFVLCYAV